MYSAQLELCDKGIIGTEEERSSLNNLVKAIDADNRYGIHTLGVVAVGKNMARDTPFSCWQLGFSLNLVRRL